MPTGEPLPEVFRARFATLEEQFLTKEPGDLFAQCFGCGPEQPRRYEGPRGAAHGGIVTTYLDEVLAGAAVRATDRLSVTGEITVRFVKPVPLETPILGRGRLTARHDRYVDVEGSLEKLATSEVLARARGRFFFQDAGARQANANSGG